MVLFRNYLNSGATYDQVDVTKRSRTKGKDTVSSLYASGVGSIAMSFFEAAHINQPEAMECPSFSLRNCSQYFLLNEL